MLDECRKNRQKTVRERREQVRQQVIDCLDGGRLAEARELLGVLREDADGFDFFLEAHLLLQEGRGKEALPLAQRALRDKSLPRLQRGACHNLLAELHKAAGEMEEAAREYLLSSRDKDIAHGKLADYSNHLLYSHYIHQDRAAALAAAKGYGRLLAGVRPRSHKPRRRHEKIRVGYLSPDFRPHIVACFASALFAYADKERFEVYGYAACPENKISRRFAQSAAAWRQVEGLSAEEVAASIAADEIDILVELSGHTGGTCLPVLAYRPAPVQVAGIGYFSTTGLEAVDYFLADVHTAGEEDAACFTERLVRLAHSHLCYLPLEPPSYLPPAPYRMAGCVTFGTLSQFPKLNPEVLALWSQVLAAVPGSRLFLKSAVFDTAAGREQALARLQAAGIPASRVMAEGYTDDYWAAYAQIDIALDPFPYPGGGTTCDAVYMGVPVVTLAGSTHHQRFGASIMANLGEDIAELCVAATPEEYVQKAAALAADLPRLTLLHHLLRLRLESSALGDGHLYMADLESAYTHMYTVWLQQDRLYYAREAKAWLQRAGEAQRSEEWGTVERECALLAAGTEGRADKAFWAAAACNRLRSIAALGWARTALAYGTKEPGLMLQAEGKALMDKAWLLAAERVFAKALADPDTMNKETEVNVLMSYAYIGATLGRQDAPERYRRSYEAASAVATDSWCAYSSWLLAYNSVETDEQDFFLKSCGYAQALPEAAAYVHERRRRHGKLRVGYVSPDFREHVMFHFYMPLLASFDRSRFEVYAYSMTDKPDRYTELVRSWVTVWRDCRGMSDMERPEKLAALVYEDEIDILFDLAGHTGGSGLPALARRPAPVQISGLGYMATTGLRAVDYFLTDAFVDPPGLNEHFFTEKLLRIPGQFCYNGRADAPEPVGAPSRERGWILFGVFNACKKYTDEMLCAWRDILAAVPGSKLLLKCQPFVDSEFVEEVKGRLIALGFDLDRVIIEPATRDYLKRYLDVDIALDTYPWPGGGTTCDALYMGVPVVTRYGKRHSSRFSYGILCEAGLEDLAADTVEGYVALAVHLAREPELLDGLHRQLRPLLRASYLMDARAYIAAVESRYEEIYAAWLAGGTERREGC